MTNRSMVVGCIATLSLVAVVAAQTGAQQAPSATPPATSTPATGAAGTRTQTAAPPQGQVQVVTTAEQEKQLASDEFQNAVVQGLVDAVMRFRDARASAAPQLTAGGGGGR